MENRFCYIALIDKFADNIMYWYKKGGTGYTTDIQEAQIFSFTDANRIVSGSDKYKIWDYDLVSKSIHLAVDWQTLSKTLDDEIFNNPEFIEKSAKKINEIAGHSTKISVIKNVHFDDISASMKKHKNVHTVDETSTHQPTKNVIPKELYLVLYYKIIMKKNHYYVKINDKEFEIPTIENTKLNLGQITHRFLLEHFEIDLDLDKIIFEHKHPEYSCYYRVIDKKFCAYAVVDTISYLVSKLPNNNVRNLELSKMKIQQFMYDNFLINLKLEDINFYKK